MNKYIVVKVFSVLIAAYSQILLKQSAVEKHKNFINEYLNPKVLAAYFIFFASMLMSVYALKGISVSYSMVIEAISYVLIPVNGHLLFNERINKKQFLGIILIIIGILIYSQ